MKNSKYNFISRREMLSLLSGTAAVFLPTPMFQLISSCSDHSKSCNKYNDSYHMNVNDLIDLMDQFTETYKKYSADDIELRETACMAIQWKGVFQPVQQGDLFVGRVKQLPIGWRPQSDENMLGYYIHYRAIEQLFNSPSLKKEKRKKLEELAEFWKTANTVSKTKMAYSEEMKVILPSDNYIGESGIAFTLWRMSGIQLNYRKLVEKGIPGMREEIMEFLSHAVPGTKQHKLYTSMIDAIDIFCDVCRYYSGMTKEMARNEPNTSYRKDLNEMSVILEKITETKPESFREGLHLMFLYNAIDGTRNYGRMDDALGDLYSSDLNAGRITEDEAIRLLTSIWKLMADRNYRYDTRIVIGGKGRVNEENADKLALLIIETSNRVRDIVPQLALRFYEGQNPTLYEKALDVIGSGYPYPMLYNDDVNIPAVQKAFDVPYDEAIHAIQFGCGEYVLDHRSVGTPSAVINLLQALLVTINKGYDPKTGLPMGMPLTNFKKYNNFETFEDLFNAYKEQVEYHIVALAKHEELEYIYAGKDNPYLYSSMLMDDCLARGKAIFDGGIRYLGGTLESYGNTNCANSLTAIRELVYEKKLFTLEQLNEMLKVNFVGFEKERKLLLACPKYGNDDPVADEMYLRVHNHVCNFTRKQKKTTGLHSYLIVIINNDANTVMGMQTPASPDGRFAFTYMNPGNNPSGGSDKNGLTALLNSLAKPDPSIHAGAVQNMKFSKELFKKNRPQLEALLKTYFSKGGTQAMITVVSRGELEDAIKHPEKYQNLIVRVGGFSERFVNLPPKTQREILSRTLY